MYVLWGGLCMLGGVVCVCGVCIYAVYVQCVYVVWYYDVCFVWYHLRTHIRSPIFCNPLVPRTLFPAGHRVAEPHLLTQPPSPLPTQVLQLGFPPTPRSVTLKAESTAQAQLRMSTKKLGLPSGRPGQSPSPAARIDDLTSRNPPSSPEVCTDRNHGLGWRRGAGPS